MENSPIFSENLGKFVASENNNNFSESFQENFSFDQE